MFSPTKRWVAALAVALLPVLAVACGPDSSPGPVAANPVSGPSFSAGDQGPGNGLANFEHIEVCKFGSTADVTVQLTQATHGVTSVTHSFADGECRVLGNFDGTAVEGPADITASESNIQSGFQFDSLRSTVIFRNPSAPTQVTKSTTNSFVFNGANDRIGILVEFFNSAIPTGGGEGCTPGFWKQPQHFSFWTAPYDPGDLFSSVFEDAFPGLTLLQVLQQGGGGLNALGRHTVAALLNAASPNVDYDLTTAEVIAAFNAVFPGGDYEGQKNIFAGFNQQHGTPICD